MTLVSGQDYVALSDITVQTSSPGSCSDSAAPFMLKNPCTNITPGAHTVISCPAGNPVIVDLNRPSVYYNPGSFPDSVSTAVSDPTFCGQRQFAFTRTDTGGSASDLVTENISGGWDI